MHVYEGFSIWRDHHVSEDRAKRKLTAILSADVKGYSRLMGEDERATVETIKQYREIIGKLVMDYNGRVIDSPGDNILSEFSSVVDALECAVKIQEELKGKNTNLPETRRMEFRIGVNLGDVIEDEGRIYGDGVNVAARIEGLAEGGGICISSTAFDQVKNKLKLGYEYLGEHTVKNIADPVRVYRVLMEPEAAGKVVSEERSRRRQWRWAAIGGVAILIIVVAVLAIWNVYFRPPFEPASIERMAFPLPDKPSIAVLPFINLGADQNQEFLADGLTENIITSLSKTPKMFVIDSNSIFTYKGKSVKVQQVAEDLGVRYVLKGSIQRSGDRLRIMSQLIDALKGHHLWAERYDRDLKELFSLQDEITLKILTALQVNLTRGEEARMHETTDNLEAWGHFVRALSLFERFTKGDNAKARELFERAVKLDPEYAAAWSLLAWTHWIDSSYGFSESPAESFKRAVDLAQKAVAVNDKDPDVHALLGGIYLFQGEHERAIAKGEKAIALRPNDACNHALLAQALNYAGRFEEAILLLNKAKRLNPVPPPWYFQFLGDAYRYAGQYEKSIASYENALHQNPDYLAAHIGLASVYGLVGRKEEARSEAGEVLRIDTKFSLDRFLGGQPFKDKAIIDQLSEVLRMAGLPDEPLLPLPDKPSIAVLPFTNISDDPKQEYFSDGITEDLITDLSKISGLFVIARNSTFTYKGKQTEIGRITRELGVRYVLEGSVRKIGSRVRINAQLIDGETGGHLWAERYDRELEEIFSVQDEVTEQIAKALAIRLTPGEQERIIQKGTDSTEAYDLVLRAWAYFQQYSKEANALAKKMFEKAIALDPKYVAAHIGLVWTKLLGWHMGWNQDQKAMEQAYEIAQKCVSLNDSLPKTHVLLGNVFLWKKKYDEAIAEFERAISLDTNDADSIQSLASAKNFVGKADGAIILLKKAMRLNPHYPERYALNLGRAYFQAKLYEKAISALNEALLKNPSFPPTQYYLAASYGHLGKSKEASDKVEEIKKLRPDFKSEVVKEKGFYKEEKYAEHFIEGLHKAGLI